MKANPLSSSAFALLAAAASAQQFVALEREAVPRTPGPHGWSLLVDLDGDGDRDLYFRADAYLGNDGSGRMTTRSLASPPNTHWRPHVAGDFDGDGDQDLLGWQTLDCWVLENRGAAGPVWAANDLQAPPIAVGSFNGDARIDVVTTAGVALANSLTTFQVSFQAAAGISVAAVGDMDGDGDQDVVGASSPQTVTIWTGSSFTTFTIPGRRALWRNNGAGGFTEVLPFGANPPATNAVLLIDVDGNGWTDACFHQDSGSSVWLNTGGAFTPGAAWSTPSSPRTIDFDGDGDLDVVGTSHWLEQTGPGAFTARSVPASTGELHAIADIDGDGDNDLVFGDAGAPRRLLLNQGLPDFVDATAWAWRGVDSAAGAILGDLDGDGFTDLLGARNRRDGWFDLRIDPPGPLLVDLDADGDLDALSITLADLNDGSGNFPSSAPLTYVPANSLTPLQAFDADGDGDDDLLCGPSLANDVVLMRNSGGLVFTAGNFLPLPGTVMSSAAADFDNDGDIDVLIGSPAGAGMSLLRNDGSGAFTIDPAGVVGAGSNANFASLAVGDLDGDGDIDVLAGRFGFPSVEHLLLRNTAGVLTVDATALPAHSGAGDAALGDVDADGDLDAVVAVMSGSAARLHFWRNQGGSFVFAEDLVAASTVGPARLADVDRDGDADLFSGGRLLMNRQWHFEAPFLLETGTNYVFRCGGRAAPNALALPWIGAQAFLPVPGLGNLGLDPATAVPLSPLLLVGEMAHGSFMVPANPTLVGLPISLQALLLANGVLRLTPPKHEVVRS